MATQAIATQMPVYAGRFDASMVRGAQPSLLAAQQRGAAGRLPRCSSPSGSTIRVW